MEMKPVVSSNVASVGYDEPSLTLFVRFQSGGTYEYSGVPAEEYQALCASASIGSYLAAHIKARFRAKKSEVKF